MWQDATESNRPMKLSVVLAAKNEAENLPQLIAEICTALRPETRFEIVVVDDGSTDETPRVLSEVQKQCPELVIIRHQQSCGQSFAMVTGVLESGGDMIATLDADGQNDPADLPKMLTVLLAPTENGEQVSLVAGHRQRRKDNFWRILCSRTANAVRQAVLRDGTPDTGCGIRVFRRDTFLALPRFSHMHRFLPALVIRCGGVVTSVAVNHRPRIHGNSHYDTLGRLTAGIMDLCGVAWLIHRSVVPLVESRTGSGNDIRQLDDLRVYGADDFHESLPRSVA